MTLGRTAAGKLSLAVKLHVNIPGLSQADAERLVAEAHTICPYSNATRGNIEVNFVVTNNN